MSDNVLVTLLFILYKLTEIVPTKEKYAMTPEQKVERSILMSLARSRCKRIHPDVFDSMICVGPGSEKGFGPPCDKCIDLTMKEYAAKRAKAHGRKLSPEEAAEVKKRLGIR